MTRHPYKAVYGPYPDLERLRHDLVLAFQMIEQGKRQSGRTTRLLQGMTPDHRVVVGVTSTAFMRHALRRAGYPEARVFTADPQKPLVDGGQLVMREGTRPTLYDHTWVTARLQRLIDEAFSQIAYEMDNVTCAPWSRSAARG